MSDAATIKFGAVQGENLAQCLSTLMANPDPMLFRLFTQASALQASREQLVTRDGQFQMSVSCLDDSHFLWRLDEWTCANDIAAKTGQGLHIPMMTVGARGAVLFVNDACRQFFGFRPKSLTEIFGETPLRDGKPIRIEAADGEKTVIISMLEGAVGRKEIFLIATTDFDVGTSREVLEQWDAIEDLPVPLLKISADGEVLASNREARSLLGISALNGRRIGEMLDGLGRPIRDWLREAIEGRGGYVSQFLRGRGENHDTFLQVTLNAAGGAADPHLIAVLNDVTELKTLEAQFVQSQKMQAIGQLAGGVAHDFNNLLTAISGHCDLLLLRHDQGDQNYGDLIQIHQNANRAASLAGQLLAFSRKQNLQPEVIDLRDTLSDLTHLLDRLVGEKVKLNLSHELDLAPIKADKRQLEQVLMNLVVNARDAMPEGGEIRVITENLEVTEKVVRDRAIIPTGSYVLVKVIDEGHGIAPELLHKIFEPFYTTKRVGEGTGLGLSTAYGIVKQTGGFIFCESEVGSGTVFSLLFPAHEVTVSEKIAPKFEAPKAISGSDDGVVLVVEDEAPVRAFASRALRLRGYTVLEADCAETALEMLSDPALKVDVFVSDVIMPGMNGPTWVREARKTRANARIVFVSGYAEDAFGDEGPNIENSVFLPKPFSLNDLTITVQEEMKKVRAAAETEA